MGTTLIKRPELLMAISHLKTPHLDLEIHVGFGIVIGITVQKSLFTASCQVVMVDILV